MSEDSEHREKKMAAEQLLPGAISPLWSFNWNDQSAVRTDRPASPPSPGDITNNEQSDLVGSPQIER